MTGLGPLISGEALSALSASEVTVLTLSPDHAAYLAQHIPSSLWADLHGSFAMTRPGGIVFGIPTPAEFAEVMSALGMTPGRRLVLADDQGGRWATRAYWVCRLYGHRPVHVLDGGVPLWLAQSRATETGSGPQPEMVEYPEPAGHDGSVAADIDEVQGLVGEGSQQICDVRTAAENRGEGAPGRMARRTGRIPGSTWVPWEAAMAEDGSFRRDDDLRRALHPFTEDSRAKVTYCQGGVRASHTWFALSELLGLPARMYAGSWEEWGNRDDTPVETG